MRKPMENEIDEDMSMLRRDPFIFFEKVLIKLAKEYWDE